jgi:ankyrin repeat protein
MGTALHVAAATGKVKAANCLIQSGIDVDCQDEVMTFSANILEGRCPFTGYVWTALWQYGPTYGV